MKAPLDHPYVVECLRYKELQRKTLETATAYAKSNGIGEKEFSVCGNTFAILATPENLEKFKGQLKKTIDGKYCAFKKNGRLGKAWKDPYPNNWYMDIGWQMLQDSGKWSILQFTCESMLFVQVELSKEAKIPEGFVQIKGSEFMLAKEAVEQKEKKGFYI